MSTVVAPATMASCRNGSLVPRAENDTHLPRTFDSKTTSSRIRDSIVAPSYPLGFSVSLPSPPNSEEPIYLDAAAPNASMPPTPNGSGPELEKFPDAPPSIEVTAPEDVIDAGLRSLDHCQYPYKQSKPTRRFPYAA